jgi:hypothetical protein
MPRSLIAFLVASVFTVALHAQMPDVSQMSGVPLPTGDLPDGTVSVRVVRGDLSNNVPDIAVELHGDVGNRQARTDAEGRATFSGLTPGVSLHAMAVVDGQQLESREFTVPASGGIRVVLVAGAGAASQAATPAGSPGAPAAAPSTTPPQPGQVTFGGQSRFIVEVVDEAIDFYVLLEANNPQAAPLQPPQPLVFQIPDGADGLTLLEGSTSQAKAEGRRVVVEGPINPGRTIVQFAYRMPYGSDRLAIRQVLPAAVGQTSLLVRKVAGVTFSSPQASASGAREVTLDGNLYVVANGPAIPAGGAIEVELSNLPYHSALPRYLALLLALAVVVVGVYFATGTRVAGDGSDRRRLELRREELFAALVKLEQAHVAGRGDPARYRARREELVTDLEQVYARLEEVAPDALRESQAPQEKVAVEASLGTHGA